jgi:hypothetical protein
MIPALLFLFCVVALRVTTGLLWLTDPGYVKNFVGLIQAFTVGLPQYGATPSWMFFRNSLLSDLIFTAVFVLLMRAQSPRTSTEVAVARAA